MLHRNLRLIEEDTFELGFKLQTEWAWLITTAFFLGELGAGLFLVSLFLPGKVALMSALAGWILVAVGKNTAHLLYIGKPLLFWRGIWRPQTSWISRGFVAMTFMIIFGALHILLSLFFNVLFISGAPDLVSILNGNQMHILETLERWLIIANLVMIIIYFLTMIYSIDAAKKSAHLIFKEKYPIVFWLGVVFLGLVVIFLLPVIVTTHSIPILLAVAGCELIGDYCILFLLLRSGVFSPLMPHPNIDVTLFAKA